MTRFATFAAVMTAAGLASFVLIEESEKHQQKECREVVHFDARTSELVVNYGLFKRTLEATLKELAAGQIPLRQAAYCVRDAASVYCPIYLSRLNHAEEGTTDEERVARNLIGHLRDREEHDPLLAGRSAELQSELETLLQDHNLGQ